MRRIIIQNLAALALGLLVAGIVFGSTVLSDDIRLIVLLGTIALLLGGIFAAGKIDRGWLVGALLCLPVCGLFAFFVLQQLPFLWPTLLIWLTAATVGLFFFGARRRDDCAIHFLGLVLRRLHL